MGGGGGGGCRSQNYRITSYSFNNLMVGDVVVVVVGGGGGDVSPLVRQKWSIHISHMCLHL